MLTLAVALTLALSEGFCPHGLRNGQFCCAASCSACATDLGRSAESPLPPACSAHAILSSGRLCAKLTDVGCIVGGANEAVQHLCFWLEHSGADGCREPNSTCIEGQMQAKAEQHNTSLVLLKAGVLRRCMARRLGSAVDPLVLSTVPQWGPCSERSTRARGVPWQPLWVSLIVKDQTDMLSEWLVWHLLLGASHAVVYDNDSQDAAQVAATLKPFVDSGLVTLVRRRGHGQQTVAYDDAIQRAKRSGVPFVGFVDVDERFVPYGFGPGCLTDMMALCNESARCAGMRLSTRTTLAISKPAPAENRSAADVGLRRHSLLHTMRYDLGLFDGKACCTVKTVVRTATYLRWYTPHSTFVRRGWCHFDEALACPRNPGIPFDRQPMTAARGFVLHMHCRTLLDWVIKRSMTGRIDTSNTNACSACFGSLDELIVDFHKQCSSDAHRLGKRPPPSRPMSNYGRRSAQLFLEAVDQQLVAVLRGRRSGQRPAHNPRLSLEWTAPA